VACAGPRVRPELLSARAMRDPLKAWRAAAAALTKAERTKRPAAARKVLQKFAKHGDTLPARWRAQLVELADEPQFATDAAVGLAQVKPHRSMVMPMVRRLEARLEDELALVVLAKCADKRAAAVLTRLLEAPRGPHWDLMLMACVQTRSKTLVRPIRAWLRRARKDGVSKKWDGYEEGRQAIAAL